ncbi:Amino acid permease (fragment) [Lactobacillus delbrueckii subsp. bulgaricus]
MLWSLGNEGTIPVVFAKTNKRGIPAISLLISMLGGVFSLLTSVYAADTIYLVLVSISGLAVVFVWMAIALCQLKFRLKWLKEGNTEDELKFKPPSILSRLGLPLSPAWPPAF